ncbi:lipase family protein [Arthrobacter sp. NPDC080073]|uniref:lipase family protein n=1 Tax=Arthrobacter sp. NPDC080073 TaxID=3155919 RepID=UPI0034333FA9
MGESQGTKAGETRYRARALPFLASKWPGRVRVLIGVAAIVLGVLLVSRPSSSLQTLTAYTGLSLALSGVGDLLDARVMTGRRPAFESPWVHRVLGGFWICAGILIALWRGLAMDVLIVVVGVSLALSGGLRIVRALRGGTDSRAASALLGVSDIVFSSLVWWWPDVTLLLVAALFGVRTVRFGISQLAQVFQERQQPRPRGAVGGWRAGRWPRLLGAVAALALALGCAGVGVQLRSGSPALEPFYTAPADVPAQPGRLVRSEPFDRAVPTGARAWRILYTTTNTAGSPVVASGLVIVPVASVPGGHKVIAWAHGTTGYARDCAPTLLTDPLGSGAFPSRDAVIANGWAIVSTDYAGMGTGGPQPYIIGEGEGRSVLDSVRAARQLSEAQLNRETVVWGHSQGGHAALWSGQIAPAYAPDVRLDGVVAMAPASDTIGLVRSLPSLKGGSALAAFVIAAYSATYPDVNFNSYVLPSARTMVREMATRCLSSPDEFVSILTALSLDNDQGILAADPAQGPLGARLRENIPTGHTEAPLLLAQGLADQLIRPDMQSAYVSSLCAAGEHVDYHQFAGRDHLSLVADTSPLMPQLLSWTTDRFAGKPAQASCTRS